MGRTRRWGARLVLAAGMLLGPICCSQPEKLPPPPPSTPVVRVRLLAGQNRVQLRGAIAPTIRTASESSPLRLNLPPESDVELALIDNTWQIGGVSVPGRGELTLRQAEDGSVAVNGHKYRGSFRFVPMGGGTFDVVNDVDVDGYVRGVLRSELKSGWREETYKAQAIVARTYALYEARTAGRRRSWDVYPDERSQVYGGMDVETDKSIAATSATSGVVVAYGPQRGQEKIFKAYFSSCCGGVTQSAADAFGESYFVPLSGLNTHGLCSAGDGYNWGPVEISKAELTRRLRVFGQRRDRGEKDMDTVSKIEVQNTNEFERPILFVVTDISAIRYSLTSEELRVAINAGAPKGTRLPSTYMKIVNDPGSDAIRFVEGHGVGHGVGMCQWCSEIRAEAGMRHEDIVLSAFPKARLVRGY